MVGRRLFGSFWGVCQKGLAVRAKPIFQLNACNGYVRGTAVKTERTYPFYVSRLFTGFALTASPFCQTAECRTTTKRTKKALPQRTAFAALRFPRSGPAPWPRRDGPSMAQHGSPGIHAGQPSTQNLLSACRKGLVDQDQDQDQQRVRCVLSSCRAGPGGDDFCALRGWDQPQRNRKCRSRGSGGGMCGVATGDARGFGDGGGQRACRLR